jgi:hypothetical protein
MKRSWETMREYLVLYFNELYTEYDTNYKKLTKGILRLRNTIKRIEDSKHTYLNDEAIIEEKKRSIKTMIEKRSINKKRKERIKKYQMNQHEINALVYYMNKEIVNEMLLNKEYHIPYWQGKMKPIYINFGKNNLVVNWPKSIENHLAIIEKESPKLYHMYKVEKSITKREYFKLAKQFVSPAKPHNLWLEYFEGQNWVYFRWQPNYKFLNTVDNYYRFYFTSYNSLGRDNENVKDFKTVTALAYLDTPEKIINCKNLGSVTKLIYLQIQNPDYKLKFIE